MVWVVLVLFGKLWEEGLFVVLVFRVGINGGSRI